MLKYFIILLAVSTHLEAKTNLQIIDSLTDLAMTKLIRYNNCKISLQYNLVSNTSLTNYYKNQLDNALNKIGEDKDCPIRIWWRITDLEVKYNLVNLSNNITQRKIGFSIIGIDSLNNRQSFNYSYTDLLQYNEIESLEDKELNFTKGIFEMTPETQNMILNSKKEEKSNFTKYSEPIIISIVSAAIVYALFTVRSN